MPIETVAPITAPPSPTTTGPPPRLPDRIAEPNPRWAPVVVPTGDPLRPAALATLIDDPDALAYDISPDGRHIALVTPTGGLCLRSTTEVDDEVCNESIESSFVVWAPDSSKVLFNLYSLTSFRSGPLGTFAVDGTVTALLEPSASEALFDGAVAAGFVDADTVLYSRVVNEPNRQLDVHRIAIDGGDDQLVGSLSLAGGDVFLPSADLVDGSTLYSSVNTSAVGGNGIWRYDADTDAFGRIVDGDPTGPSGLFVGSRPVAVRGGVLLSVQSGRLAAFSSHRSDARFFGLTTTDAASGVRIDDIDADYMILSAALSPTARTSPRTSGTAATTVRSARAPRAVGCRSPRPHRSWKGDRSGSRSPMSGEPAVAQPRPSRDRRHVADRRSRIVELTDVAYEIEVVPA